MNPQGSNETGLQLGGRGAGPVTEYAQRARPLSPVSDFNWEQVVRILGKNWRFGCTLAVLLSLLIAVVAFRLKNSYQPSARLEIDPQNSLDPSSTRDTENDFESRQEYLETQARILQSDDLGMRVIRSLHLDQNPAVVGAKNIALLARNNDIPGQQDRVAGSGNPVRNQAESGGYTPLEGIALSYYQSHLSVGSIRGTRLIEVSFASGNPRLSQQVTNNLVAQFIDQNFKARYESTMQASEWLTRQLDDLRQRVQDSNQAVVNYQKQFGLAEGDDKDGPTAKLAAEISHQLGDSQADRIQAEAYVRMIDEGQAGSLPQIRDSQVYQALTAKYADNLAKLAEARTIYGEENQNYKKLENETSEIAAQRETQQARIVNQVQTSFSAALQRERLMMGAMDGLKQKMGDVNERLIRYRVLKNEAQSNSELYNALLARLKEAGIYAGLKSSSIRVIDPAPLLKTPTSPHRALIMGIGILMSCGFGFVLAFVKESLNNTIRTPDDVLNWTSLPSLAMIPLADRVTTKLIPLSWRGNSVENPRIEPQISSAMSSAVEIEALRGLYTSIKFAGTETSPRSLLVTSSSAEEGKTTIAVNLAMTCAQRANVCLIDGDLRHPSLSHTFGLLKSVGLVQVLEREATLDQALVRAVGMERLFLLPAGRMATNPINTLASDEMKQLLTALREKFEYIIIDSPPVIPFADARVLSTITEGVVLVGRYRFTTKRSLARGAQILDEAGARILGIVINGMDFRSTDYHYYNYGFSRRNADAKVYKYYGSLLPPPPPSPRSQDKPKARGAAG